MIGRFWKELSKVFTARANSVRFVYRHKTHVNRKMRRTADAVLRHKPGQRESYDSEDRAGAVPSEIPVTSASRRSWHA